MAWKQPIPTDLIDVCLGHKFATTVLEKLILRARQKAGYMYIEGTPIFLERGQCFVGRIELASWFDLKPNQSGRIQRILVFLQETVKQIDKQKSRNGSIVTILCFDNLTRLEQTNNQTVDNQQTNNRQTVDTNKNVKNIKNINIYSGIIGMQLSNWLYL